MEYWSGGSDHNHSFKIGIPYRIYFARTTEHLELTIAYFAMSFFSTQYSITPLLQIER
jgi:hypothetical protein